MLNKIQRSFRALRLTHFGHCVADNRCPEIQRIHKKNQKDPGDAEGDDNLLIGLSIAQDYVGIGTGSIPIIQKLGCDIANYLDSVEPV